MSNELERRLTLGCVSYINAFPFSLELAERNDIFLHTAPPADLLAKLLDGSLQFALTSSVGSLTHPLGKLSGFGIAAYKKILSVNLYAAPTFFTSGKLRIAATKESRSSVMLLNILCRYLWNTPIPEIIQLSSDDVLKTSSENYDGLLLIGDKALHHPHISGFSTYDLAQGWYELTQLPFVFAVVLSNNPQGSATIQTALEQSLSHFEAHPEAAIAKAVERTQLPENLIKEYYSLCRYRLREEDYEGLEKFREYHAAIYQQT
ncbi:menaquinone biosynthesis protein [Chlamydia vaughanii]|uniref:menaquinone biosynthesis protein n=1 Tax=Chlamydia vaughanii TaxID=3112552 RepID=UPI0032B10AB1